MNGIAVKSTTSRPNFRQLQIAGAERIYATAENAFKWA